MGNKKLSLKQARQFLLVHQQLLPPRGLEGKGEILDFIDRVGCIQFDPLNRVGRNPDLTLQSRFKNYRPKLLRELLYSDRKLMDGWDKNKSIYLTADRPYFKLYREEAKRRFEDRSDLSSGRRRRYRWLHRILRSDRRSGSRKPR